MTSSGTHPPEGRLGRFIGLDSPEEALGESRARLRPRLAQPGDTKRSEQVGLGREPSRPDRASSVAELDTAGERTYEAAKERRGIAAARRGLARRKDVRRRALAEVLTMMYGGQQSKWRDDSSSEESSGRSDVLAGMQQCAA
jgi:hypothetical protein